MWILRLTFIALMVAAAPAAALAQSSRDLETRGTLTADNGQLAPNVWAGVSRTDALQLVDAIPTRMVSPIYYDLARKLLLSDAPAFPAEKQAPADKDKNAQNQAPRPDMLIARIDKLLGLGALRDAQNLYDSVVDEPDNFDLAYRGLQMLMLRGQLSAACLDLQAMQYRLGADDRWKEFNRFCRIRFATGAEHDKLLSESKFTALPIIDKALRNQLPAKTTSLTTEQLAYTVAMGNIGPDSVSTLASKAGAMQPLLLTVLLNLDTPEAVPQKTCLAIEAVRRGLMPTRDLITLYEKPHYEAALLLDGVGTSPAAANIHPCMIPTVLYQRIASNLKTPLRDKAIREALDVMKDLPDAAFWPMALYFRDFDVKAAANKPYLWRVSRIVAYEKGDLPENWQFGWGAKGG
ncbi:MAG: hypothetical protein KGQ41_09195, partial [Alphaproteobacteria bacterium]|nr:hypothetical protein [Alphaproteobacteria bacterium]